MSFSGEVLIGVSGLYKRFGTHQAVIDVSLELRRGEVLGLVGPNGAGKTTTLRLLAGLIVADAGAGEVVGRDIGKARRGNPALGYVPQKLALYDDLTVWDNLKFRADIYRLPRPDQHVERALADFGLADRRRQRARDLSGGWARRLQFAAALIHRPALVLLDEPTAGLDSETRQDIWRRIQALADEGAGVVINTHDLSEAERCSRVALFRLGRVVIHGRPADMEAAAPIRAALVAPAGVDDTAPGGDDVLAVEPHGRRWRVLTHADRFEAVRDRIEAAGGGFVSDEIRLSDIALLNERNALIMESAA